MNILFFIDSLTFGGKERRMLELIKYLKKNTDHSILLVLTENLINFDYVFELGIPIKIIERRGLKYDPLLFLKFYRICISFKPDIIHAWGKMTTFYAIPAKVIMRVPLVSNLISDTMGWYGISMNSMFFKADVLFSNVILSNSSAGLVAYSLKTSKARVIWNGVHLERFNTLHNVAEVRNDFNINTNFMLVMVAAFSNNKDYDLFLDIAKDISKVRNDVTFVGVGDGPSLSHIKKRIINESISNVVITGKQKEVERIISASDIGLLCTFSEGISNSIIECMALGKPVISTDLTGGSKEIIIEGETGYCTRRNVDEVVDKLNLLLNNDQMRTSMGIKAKARISEYFTIDRMGKEFLNLYESIKKGKLNG